MKFLLLICLLSSSLYAAKRSYKQLQDDLSKKSIKVNKVAATIKSLEKSIGKNNQRYIQKLEKLKLVETQLLKLKNELTKSGEEISKKYALAENLFKKYLLEKLDKEDPEELIKDKIYTTALKKQMKSLKASQLSSQKLMQQVNEFSQIVDRVRKDEKTLYDLIVDLENQKKDYAENYVNLLEERNSVRDRFEKAKARQKVSKKSRRKVKKVRKQEKVNLDLILPFDTFVSYKSSEKGVNFVYDDVSPVAASGSGHIVYSGELASYGKIIMIDHGNQLRSLVLGDIKINVKKGDYVKRGQIIAYTNASPGEKKDLYYELRRKDIAQNTYKVLKNKNLL